MVPVVEELKTVPPPADALRAFAGSVGLLLFDSALQRGRSSRYSFLSAEPLTVFRMQRATYGSDPFGDIRETLDQINSQFTLETLPELPPFQGGIAGLLSYELGSCWERIPRVGRDEFQAPDALIGLYDWVIAWDHQQNRAWILSHGLPEIVQRSKDSSADTTPFGTGHGFESRRDRAAARIQAVKNRLSGSPQKQLKLQPQTETVPEASLARQYPLMGWSGVTTDFTRPGYLSAVERVIDYIHAGDIFQANLSQRLLARSSLPPTELYATLRDCNPAPFAGYLSFDDWAIVSASPERFIRVEDGIVETRPIKGTRQRRRGPEADLFTRDELRQSEKDLAENVMIVDLLRNDLSRVCEPGTIAVPELCVVETYETVQHLVSEVRGQLKTTGSPAGRNSGIWSLLAAAFPGGSITGAPKVRAMQIISELEPTARGPYCGSLFYSGFDGRFDSSILIRSFVCRRGWIQCRVGGGIVAQSDPAAEYEETMHKAEGMLRALEQSGLASLS